MSNSVFMVQKAVYGFKFGDTAGYECVSNVPIMLHAIPFNLSSRESKIKLSREICLFYSILKYVLTEDTYFYGDIRQTKLSID